MRLSEDDLKKVFKHYNCIPGGTKEASIRLHQIFTSGEYTISENDMMLLRKVLAVTFFGVDVMLPELYRCGGGDCYAAPWLFCHGEMETCDNTMGPRPEKTCPHYSPEDK